MKVTPKERRARLFSTPDGRPDKPVIRPAVHDDIKWEWVNMETSQWNGQGETIDHDQWLEAAVHRLAVFDQVAVIEDRNTQFAKGWGPVCIVGMMSNEWVLEPHSRWFNWATPRNKLRGTVEFLRLLRNSHGVGVVHLKSNQEDAKWFKRLSKRYVPLYPVGKIPHGRPDGDEWLFYLRGSKNVGLLRRRGRGRGIFSAPADRANAPSIPDDHDGRGYNGNDGRGRNAESGQG